MIENFFLALNLSDEFKNFLEEKVNLLKDRSDAFKWEKKERFHITLKYYGLINPVELGKIKEAIELMDKFPKIILELNGFSYFTTYRKHNTLYASFKFNRELDNFVQEIFRKTDFIEKQSEHKKFTPHVTIARARKKPEEDFLNYFRNYDSGSYTEEITSASIYKSIQYTTGTIYKEIKKYNF